MGTSVKSSSRKAGTEQEYVSIPNDNFEKAKAARDTFGCVPHIAIVVDAGNTIRGFILSMEHLLELFPQGRNVTGWKMTDHYLRRYAEDPAIKTFEFETKNTTRWW